MVDQTAHPLTYASPAPPVVGAGSFRIGLFVFAVVGILANVGFIASALREVLHAWDMHAALLVNPKAFGRLVPPADIAELGRPFGLWVSAGLFAGATAAGVYLASLLLMAAVRMGTWPELSTQHLIRYRQFKLWGVLFTTATMGWFNVESVHFRATALRHFFVGELPAIAIPLMVALFGVWAWRWVGRHRA